MFRPLLSIWSSSPKELVVLHPEWTSCLCPRGVFRSSGSTALQPSYPEGAKSQTLWEGKSWSGCEHFQVYLSFCPEEPRCQVSCCSDANLGFHAHRQHHHSITMCTHSLPHKPTSSKAKLGIDGPVTQSWWSLLGKSCQASHAGYARCHKLSWSSLIQLVLEGTAACVCSRRYTPPLLYRSSRSKYKAHMGLCGWETAAWFRAAGHKQHSLNHRRVPWGHDVSLGGQGAGLVMSVPDA